MTSNVGSHLPSDAWEEPSAKPSGERSVSDAMMAELRRTFRPEFLNRIDDIVVFHRLGRAELDRIVDVQLGRLRKLLAERDLDIELTPDALRFLGDQGYDPVYGARPLKRAIMRFVQDPLAGLLLKGEFGPGETILVDRKAGADELTFKKNRRPTVAAVS
jgi:ATP-dependent Clp protease ATP-binding subunit ClpB